MPNGQIVLAHHRRTVASTNSRLKSSCCISRMIRLRPTCSMLFTQRMPTVAQTRLYKARGGIPIPLPEAVRLARARSPGRFGTRLCHPMQHLLALLTGARTAPAMLAAMSAWRHMRQEAPAWPWPPIVPALPSSRRSFATSARHRYKGYAMTRSSSRVGTTTWRSCALRDAHADYNGSSSDVIRSYRATNEPICWPQRRLVARSRRFSSLLRFGWMRCGRADLRGDSAALVMCRHVPTSAPIHGA